MIKSIFIYLLLAVALFAQPEIPELNRYAVDYTSTLSKTDLYRINNALAAFDDSTSTQIVLLMISSLNGYPIENYAYEVAAKNQIGTKNNNGVLFVVVKDDRKMRIEVGYGLEGALTDALSSSIIRNEVAPYFRSGDYLSGVAAGLNSIILATKGEYTNNNGRNNDDGGKGFGSIISFIIFFIIFVLSRSNRRGRGGGAGFIFLGSGLGSGSSGFGGGGSSFGGFSGGGGSFGGGGASGGW